MSSAQLKAIKMTSWRDIQSNVPKASQAPVVLVAPTQAASFGGEALSLGMTLPGHELAVIVPIHCPSIHAQVTIAVRTSSGAVDSRFVFRVGSLSEPTLGEYTYDWSICPIAATSQSFRPILSNFDLAVSITFKDATQLPGDYSATLTAETEGIGETLTPLTWKILSEPPKVPVKSAVAHSVGYIMLEQGQTKKSEPLLVVENLGYGSLYIEYYMPPNVDIPGSNNLAFPTVWYTGNGNESQTVSAPIHASWYAKPGMATMLASVSDSDNKLICVITLNIIVTYSPIVIPNVPVNKEWMQELPDITGAGFLLDSSGDWLVWFESAVWHPNCDNSLLQARIAWWSKAYDPPGDLPPEVNNYAPGEDRKANQTLLPGISHNSTWAEYFDDLTHYYTSIIMRVSWFCPSSESGGGLGNFHCNGGPGGECTSEGSF